MAIALTEPIETYFAAVNGDDVDGALGCFEEDATVRDERRTIRGRTDIRRWIVDTKMKYQHTIQPLKSATEDDKVIVTSRLSGSFPGSPVDARFAFVLRGGKISSLEIR